MQTFMYNFTIFWTLSLHLMSVQVRNGQCLSALLHNHVSINGICTIPSKMAQKRLSRFSRN